MVLRWHFVHVFTGKTGPVAYVTAVNFFKHELLSIYCINQLVLSTLMRPAGVLKFILLRRVPGWPVWEGGALLRHSHTGTSTITTTVQASISGTKKKAPSSINKHFFRHQWQVPRMIHVHHLISVYSHLLPHFFVNSIIPHHFSTTVIPRKRHVCTHLTLYRSNTLTN